MDIELVKKIVASAYCMGVKDNENGTVSSVDDAVAQWLASGDGKALASSAKAK